MQLLGNSIGPSAPFLISGPCVIEGEALCLEVAETLRGMAERLGIMVIFKASFDKANRTSGQSFRGHGLEEGLRVLEKVRSETGLPVLTDVHSADQVVSVAEVVDMLQTPAFLARQTDLIEAAAASGRPVNFKKAQFMSPAEMGPVVAKARAAAERAGQPSAFCVCERGASFGYNNLVVDMRGLVQLRSTGCPVVFDATHSVQQPGALGDRSGGQSEFVAPLARAAVAVGVDGLFMECHPRPDEALSDGPNAVRLDQVEPLMRNLLDIARSADSACTEDRGGRQS
jgi:2-dehydro-3-deoxyphosphooctonate aldolase (KDO 8-P synthase)